MQYLTYAHSLITPNSDSPGVHKVGEMAVRMCILLVITRCFYYYYYFNMGVSPLGGGKGAENYPNKILIQIPTRANFGPKKSLTD